MHVVVPCEVEKAHANIQVDIVGRRAAPKRPYTLQQDSFILFANLEHKALLDAVEEETFGSSKQKIHRVLSSRLLHSSCMSTTGMSSAAYKKRFSVSDLSQRRPNVLSGLLLEPQWRKPQSEFHVPEAFLAQPIGEFTTYIISYKIYKDQNINEIILFLNII